MSVAAAAASSAPRHPTLYQTYYERSESGNIAPLAVYLYRLIHLKRTNLCVSADVTTSTELLQLAEEVGDQICVLKTHADIIHDFNEKTMRGLTDVARRRKFIIFEDRKFGDIGNTVQQQYTAGPLSIVRWAPLINAHIFPGPTVITALSQAAQKAIAAHNTSVSTDISASPSPSQLNDVDDSDVSDDDDDSASEADSATAASETSDERKGRKRSIVSVSTTLSQKTETISPQPALRPTLSRSSTSDTSASHDEDADELLRQLDSLGPPPFYRACLLLAEMSSADNFFTPAYTAACATHARSNRDFVTGFIAQRSLNTQPGDNFLTLTPGVQLAAGGDALGQQYNTPRKVVGEGGSDVIIVGRGVLGAQDRRVAALEYRKQAWMAYEERVRGGRGRAAK